MNYDEELRYQISEKAKAMAKAMMNNMLNPITDITEASNTVFHGLQSVIDSAEIELASKTKMGKLLYV